MARYVVKFILTEADLDLKHIIVEMVILTNHMYTISGSVASLKHQRSQHGLDVWPFITVSHKIVWADLGFGGLRKENNWGG